MYDSAKLTAFWKEKDKIRANWYKNGWKGPGTEEGRNITYTCGHTLWAGWGIPNLEKDACIICRYEKKR
jgi:hypothetical protein